MTTADPVTLAADRYRAACAAHYEAFVTYGAGTDPTHLNACETEEIEAREALLKTARAPVATP